MERDLANNLILMFFHWAHAVAAALWLGGGIVMHLINHRDVSAKTGVNRDFSALIIPLQYVIKGSMWALVITGGVLVFSRLAESSSTVAYVLVLSVKVALVGVMFMIVGRRFRNPPKFRSRGSDQPSGHTSSGSRINALIASGLFVFLLSEILSALTDGSLFG